MPRFDCDLSGVSDEDLQGGGGWEVLPDGEYRFMIVDSDIKTTKAGTGQYIELKLQCVEPGQKATIYERLNFDNPSAEATRIGRAQIKAYAIATQLPNPNRFEKTEDLHRKVFVARVGSEPVQVGFKGDRNGMVQVVYEVKPVAGGQTAAAPPAQPSAQAPAEPQADPFADRPSDDIPDWIS